MEKRVKMIAIIITVIALLMCLATVSNGFGVNNLVKGNTITGTSEITDAGGKILSVITTIGIVLSVVVLAIIGIKYMLGSANEKAEYKQALMPYLIGAVLVFAASAIAQIIYLFVKP